ncbi:MAG: hypothetical protein CSYNP_01136 [Syntrophus sp. SKADARSKE-3]|nr:hypothetical protein [Syntrophus sp. SKADARSKE-3]
MINAFKNRLKLFNIDQIYLGFYPTDGNYIIGRMCPLCRRKGFDIHRRGNVRDLICEFPGIIFQVPVAHYNMSTGKKNMGQHLSTNVIYINGVVDIKDRCPVKMADELI